MAVPPEDDRQSQEPNVIILTERRNGSRALPPPIPTGAGATESMISAVAGASSPWADSTIPWGIKPVDMALGGLQDGGKFFLYGDAQFDLLAMVLTFLVTGLERRERVAPLTSEDPEHVKEVLRFLGMPIEESIAGGEFVILKCKPFFGEKLIQLEGAKRIRQEMVHLLGSPLPERIGVFPLGSLLSYATADQLRQTTRMVCEALETISPTVMTAELSRTAGSEELYVVAEMRRRFDATFRVGTSPVGARQLILEKDRTGAWKGLRWDYFIQRGSGVQAIQTQVEEGGADPENPKAAGIMLVSDDQAEINLLKQGMEPHFSFQVVGSETEAMFQLSMSSRALVLIDFREIERSLSFCRYMRTQGVQLPVVILGPQLRRAAERASILLQGADDFVPRPVAPIELMSRMVAILRRTPVGFQAHTIAQYIGAHETLEQKHRQFRKRGPGTGLAPYQFFMSALRYELFKAKVAGYPCCLVAFQVEGGDESFDSVWELLQKQRRSSDLITLLPATVFLTCLSQEGPPEAKQFVSRFGRAAGESIAEQVGDLKYAIVSYPHDGLAGDDLVVACSSKLSREPEHVAL